jgi:hypothetical protein
MTSAEKAASIGLPNLLRSDRPDGEAQSFLFAFNLWAWRPLRSYSLHQIRERWKYFALALGRRDEVVRVTEMTIDGPARSACASTRPRAAVSCVRRWCGCTAGRS